MKLRQMNMIRAFTLVEALAVMALVAIVLPVVMFGISQASNAAGMVSQRAVANRLAADKLTEMIVSNQWESGDAAGDVEDKPVVYHWTFHTQPWTAPAQATVFSGANQNTVQAGQTGGGNLANQANQTSQTNLSNILQLDVEVTWQAHGSARSVYRFNTLL